MRTVFLCLDFENCIKILKMQVKAPALRKVKLQFWAISLGITRQVEYFHNVAAPNRFPLLRASKRISPTEVGETVDDMPTGANYVSTVSALRIPYLEETSRAVNCPSVIS